MQDSSARHSRLFVAPAVLAVLLGAACAREEPPPGARPDRIPPTIREIKPEPLTVVPDFGGSVQVRFDEPITGTRSLQQTLVASPAFRYQVSSGFSNIKIKPREGWREGVVYYFQIPEGVADLLGNRTQQPIVVVFSTGADLSETRVSGEVRRRTDASPISPGRVLFYNVAGDSIPYGVVTDRQGKFELPFLPPDDYWSFGFEDLNGNLLLERTFEPYDSARVNLAPEGLAGLAFRIVDPDTTPPVMGRLRVVDSLQVGLEFDDHLDPEQDFSAAGLVLRQLESGSRWEVEELSLQPEAPARGRRPGERERERERAAQPVDTVPETGGVADTIGAVPPDTAGTVSPDTAAAQEAPRADAQEPGPAPEPEEVLPSRTLLVRLAAPLVEGTYRLSLARILNLRQLPTAIDTVFAYPVTEDDGGGEGASGGEPMEPPAEQEEEGEGEGARDRGRE